MSNLILLLHVHILANIDAILLFCVGLQQLVIQNAREKILSDTFLQEKLAENINKILAR